VDHFDVLPLGAVFIVGFRVGPAGACGRQEGRSLMVMKVYSPEFKADAVALYLSDPSHTFEGIGKDLGISRETLRNWVRAERARRGEHGTTSTNTKEFSVSEATKQELEAEIAALRAELKTVRKENQKLVTERDILRKATKFFATEMNW
jgi:transposase